MLNDSNIPRVVFIGDASVGKTSLIYRAKYDTFNDNTSPTVGAGITQVETICNGVQINYQLWDTAGQEIYRSIVPMYFKGICGAILVFSLSDRAAFQHLQSWMEEVCRHADHQIPIVIVGNKTDVPAEPSHVQQAEATKWSATKNLPILFTSASTGANVKFLLDHVLQSFVLPSMGGMATTLEEGGQDCC
jgi:small GTP-binding protein